jgi:hypothetical protein
MLFMANEENPGSCPGFSYLYIKYDRLELKNRQVWKQNKTFI